LAGTPADLLVEIFGALAIYTRNREQHDDMTAAVIHYEGVAGF
jgi:hypothetical protein